MTGLVAQSLLLALAMLPLVAKRRSQLVQLTGLCSMAVLYWLVALFVLPRLG
jgi:hypothetical protein